MKITIHKDELLKGLAKAINAVNPRSTLPILANVLLATEKNNTLQITGTDLELGIIHTVPVIAIHEEGTITVPAKKFTDIIRELPEPDVEITVMKNHSVNIKSGKAYFRLVGLPKDDFPQFPAFSREKGFTIEQGLMRECISLTAFAISSDETRYVLNGALLIIKDKCMKMVATDGRRLAFIEKKGISIDTAASSEIIIPTKALQEINRNLDTTGKVHIISLGNSIVFSLQDTVIVTRLIEGHFPNYEQVIPKEEMIVAKINRDLFLSTVRRVSLLTSLDAQAIKIDVLKNNKMILSSRSPNLGESKEEIEIDRIKGEEITVGFNPQYLIDVLRCLDVEEIELSLSTPEKPGVIRGKEGYVYVIMPMQIT